MLNAIKAFFNNNFIQQDKHGGREHLLKLATAALLIEMTRMDDHIHENERNLLTSLVQAKFDLTDQQTNELIALAEAELQNSVDYYQFTSLINQNFEYPERVHMIELLWQIAFADNVLDKDEEYLVRKVAELIYVSQEDFISAKLKVRGSNDI